MTMNDTFFMIRRLRCDSVTGPLKVYVPEESEGMIDQDVYYSHMHLTNIVY